MIYGWDLGGAHVKLAVLDRDGRLQHVAQAPCELWMGLERLEAALASLGIGEASGALHAVTMTGELTDVFSDRAAGVTAITERFMRAANTDAVRLFTGMAFVAPRALRTEWPLIASANWRASALLTAQLAPNALLIDIGSTTTDITPIAAGKVEARGVDDRTRLAAEELVYTGAVRTPLMALAQSVPFGGERVGLMAEHFATTADVYRVSGELDAQFDQAQTADGRGRSKEDSFRRLARMIGCDVGQAPLREWERLADWFAHAQALQIRHACDRILSRGLLSDGAPVVGLGVGRFIAARIARQIGRDDVDFAELAGVAPAERAAVNVCGPAFSVARLALSAQP
jgi:probable H4MPT-linked C1 transfer pathway protein